MKAIRAAAHIGVDQRCLQIVFAEEPPKSPPRPRWPLGANVGTRCRDAGGNRRQRFNRLLIERVGQLADFAKALSPNGPEAT
jgi:hypothetical protein